MKTITTLTLSFLLAATSHTIYAQTSANVAIKLGDYSQAYTIEKSASYKISEPELKKNSKLNIYSTEGAYKILNYQIAILSPRGELVGPWEMSEVDIYAAITQKRLNLPRGTRIYIEDINAECADCTNDKKVVAPGVTILVQ